MEDLGNYISDSSDLEQIQKLVTSENALMIFGPDQDEKLSFLKACYALRRSKEGSFLLSNSKEFINDFKNSFSEVSAGRIGEKLKIEPAVRAAMRHDPSSYLITEEFVSVEDFLAFYELCMVAQQYNDFLCFISSYGSSEQILEKWRELISNLESAGKIYSLRVFQMLVAKEPEDTLKTLAKNFLFIEIKNRKISSIDQWVSQQDELVKQSLI